MKKLLNLLICLLFFIPQLGFSGAPTQTGFDDILSEPEFIKYADAFGKGSPSYEKFNYRQRIAEIRKLNPTLAVRILNANMVCISQPKDSISLNFDKPVMKVGPSVGAILPLLNTMSMRFANVDTRAQKNTVGAKAFNLVQDMLKESIIREAPVETWKVMVRIGCITNFLLTRYSLIGHYTTAPEKKIERNTGNCWDNSHVAITIAKDFSIPLSRLYKGVHMFVGYQFDKKNNAYFAIDALDCPDVNRCSMEIIQRNEVNLEGAQWKAFINKKMAEGSCKLDRANAALFSP